MLLWLRRPGQDRFAELAADRERVQRLDRMATLCAWCLRTPTCKIPWRWGWCIGQGIRDAPIKQKRLALQDESPPTLFVYATISEVSVLRTVLRTLADEYRRRTQP